MDAQEVEMESLRTLAREAEAHTKMSEAEHKKKCLQETEQQAKDGNLTPTKRKGAAWVVGATKPGESFHLNTGKQGGNIFMA